MDAVRPAVVSIAAAPSTRRDGHGRTHAAGRDESVGSGLILEANGYLLTNDHLLRGFARVTVRTAARREHDARVVGRDPLTDLALLKIEAGGPFPIARLGDSDRLRVGDWVLAVGNPLGLEHSVTVGIVSGKHRVIGEGPDDDFIQTDALTNPGSSGGPLVNVHGEVVGIHNIGFGEGGEPTGIGLAIPVNLVKAIVPQLKATGRVSRGWLGIKSGRATSQPRKSVARPPTEGAVVTDVSRKGPGAQAGLQVGDVIAAVEGKVVRTEEELARMVAGHPAGREVALTVLRGGQTLAVKVKLGELPVRQDRGHGHARAAQGI
jgi:serine protease Do